MNNQELIKWGIDKEPYNGLTIKFKKCLDGHVAEDIQPPLVTEGNACFDFYLPEKTVIEPNAKSVKVGTGIAMAIPDGYHMKLFMRSSYGAKRNLRMSNCVGIIDSSYRNEIMALFDNCGDVPEIIEKGERFCQGLIERNIGVQFIETNELDKTSRKGGFGSTGK